MHSSGLRAFICLYENWSKADQYADLMTSLHLNDLNTIVVVLIKLFCWVYSYRCHNIEAVLKSTLTYHMDHLHLIRSVTISALNTEVK